ncbi:MAG TPA: alpha/beta fold hydrolase [Longimicrobiales bacterium]|nr:alpha/beta fold hydrolase [Longimicrobiales bacterium]
MKVGWRQCVVDGRSVRYFQRGTGEDIVLVHGLGLAAGHWGAHMHRLARSGYRVTAPDLPGFGRSAGPRTGMSVPATAAWLDRFAERAGIQRAAWVGHSISCQALLTLAATRPARVGALVLAAPTGQGRGASRIGRQLVGLTRDAFHERPGLVARVVRRYFRAPVAILGTWLRARWDNPTVVATAVHAPALIVLGQEDPMVEEGFARRLAAALPSATITRLAGAAHAVALDPHRPFCDTIVAFLRDLEN